MLVCRMDRCLEDFGGGDLGITFQQDEIGNAQVFWVYMPGVCRSVIGIGKIRSCGVEEV